MNKANLDLLKIKNESTSIYQRLCNSESRLSKCFKLEIQSIRQCLENTLAVLMENGLILNTGSRGEGTHITSEDYGKHMLAMTPGYISDMDIMNVLCYVRVIDEGDMLPERFGSHMYFQAERGEHTTDGFRKLRLIHKPEYYSRRQYTARQLTPSIHMSIKHGYLSSSTFVAHSVSETQYFPLKVRSIQMGIGTQGPSQTVALADGSTHDSVECFYVKTWPKESQSWFTRQTHWPDKKLKSKIQKIGYLLVPTGNSNSQESDLEWRCSFSIAEKILFQSITTFQRYIFVMFKVLIKEYLPSDINTNSEKQLLSTYHIKTLFLWSLEDSKIKWQPENTLDIMYFLLHKLSAWINHKYFPHYFIPSVNLLNIRGLHGRDKLLICFISAIRNDLSNKMKQSKFFMGQESMHIHDSGFELDDLDRCSYVSITHDRLLHVTTGIPQIKIHSEIFDNFSRKFSHSLLIENIISIKRDIDPQIHNLYRAVYSDPIHDKLLAEVVPGLLNQYRGCIHLAKYCMAARDGCVLPCVLHTAESLLKATLHLDPCSGYVKLACLYIATRNFVQAMDRLHVAENNFLHIHKNMVETALINLQLNGVEVDRLSSEFWTVGIQEVFQKWVEGQVTSDIVVTWPEYITAPDLLQFELIHESTKYVIYDPCSDGGLHSKMVGLDYRLRWPPLSLVKLLKFVCIYHSGGSSTSHMENLVADLVTSSLSITVLSSVNNIYTVFNMAAWCYVKINKCKPAARMMIVAIGTSSQTKIMKRCAFSHHFLAYIIAQCLL